MSIHETAIVNGLALVHHSARICEYAVIGAEPFSFDFKLGGYEKQNPKGDVQIRENVFIGSHSTIVKGMENSTVIHNEVKIAQKCIIGHDCVIGEGTLIMNSVTLNGYVHIGKLCIIGSGSQVRERINIGDNTIIGMGSVVTKDMPNNVVAWGNPCRIQKKNDRMEYYLKRMMMKL